MKLNETILQTINDLYRFFKRRIDEGDADDVVVVKNKAGKECYFIRFCEWESSVGGEWLCVAGDVIETSEWFDSLDDEYIDQLVTKISGGIYNKGKIRAFKGNKYCQTHIEIYGYVNVELANPDHQMFDAIRDICCGLIRDPENDGVYLSRRDPRDKMYKVDGVWHFEHFNGTICLCKDNDYKIINTGGQVAETHDPRWALDAALSYVKDGVYQNPNIMTMRNCVNNQK